MRILEAKDGYEALELVANNAPDFVFMDVDMPGISGIETCRRLRARDDAADVPVLIVTGADDQETIDLGFEAGATQYITKPLNWPLLGRLVKYMLRSAENLHELKAKEDHLRYLAYFDHLTDLPNRRSFTEQLRRNLVNCEKTQGQVGLIMIDIDHFKLINDQHGHDTGDRILQRIAEILKDRMRVQDTVARWGGEEFLVIVESVTRDEAASIAESLRGLIERGTTEILATTISIGVAHSNTGQGVDQILKRADEGLYAAKNSGRNKVVTV